MLQVASLFPFSRFDGVGAPYIRLKSRLFPKLLLPTLLQNWSLTNDNTYMPVHKILLLINIYRNGVSIVSVAYLKVKDIVFAVCICLTLISNKMFPFSVKKLFEPDNYWVNVSLRFTHTREYFPFLKPYWHTTSTLYRKWVVFYLPQNFFYFLEKPTAKKLAEEFATFFF